MKKIRGKSRPMNEEYAYWRIKQSSILDRKSSALDMPKRKAYSIEFIQRSLTVFGHRVGTDNLDLFISSTSELISKIPDNRSTDKDQLFAYYKALAIHKDEVRSHYKLVPKGYYLSIFLPASIALGILAALFWNPFWLYIATIPVSGISIGVLLDLNACRKNMVI